MFELSTLIIAGVILLAGLQFGGKAGAFAALKGALGSALALAVAMRLWYPLARWVGREVPLWPTGWIAAAVFAALFLVVLLIYHTFCSQYFSQFEENGSDLPETGPFQNGLQSFFRWILGAVFGIVNGGFVIAALLLVASVALPLLAPPSVKEKPQLLPNVALETLPAQGWRWVEARVAKIAPDSPAHTRLPKAKNADPAPDVFWE
jgi:uncharacterized membrane protein required for colicin V production